MREGGTSPITMQEGGTSPITMREGGHQPHRHAGGAQGRKASSGLGRDITDITASDSSFVCPVYISLLTPLPLHLSCRVMERTFRQLDRLLTPLPPHLLPCRVMERTFRQLDLLLASQVDRNARLTWLALIGNGLAVASVGCLIIGSGMPDLLGGGLTCNATKGQRAWLTSPTWM